MKLYYILINLIMVTTGQNDDDLIILSDNINTTFDLNPIISQNVDFWTNDSIISFDEPILNLDTEPKITQVVQQSAPLSQLQADVNEPVSETISFINEPENNLINTTTSNLSFEVWEDVEKKDENVWESVKNLFWDINQSQEIKESQSIVDNNIYSWQPIFNSIDIKEEKEDSLLDMNAILNNTIDRLKKRQSWIASKKSDKTSMIIELERQIKELRDQVIMLKKEIVFLDEENIKIEINVWNLESMKILKSTKAVVSKVREHNTKKLVKEVKALPKKS